jgi:hypothetical protein
MSTLPLPPYLAEMLTRPRVPWARFADATIEVIAAEARAHGDEALHRRAIAALARSRRVTGCR